MDVIFDMKNCDAAPKRAKITFIVIAIVSVAMVIAGIQQAGDVIKTILYMGLLASSGFGVYQSFVKCET